jgi:AmpD protein
MFIRTRWHAGPSCYRLRDACNDFAIAVELEGQDHEPYEDVRYRQLAEPVQLLRSRFPAIWKNEFVGNCDIAPPRKTDPGPAFDASRLRCLLAQGGVGFCT